MNYGDVHRVDLPHLRGHEQSGRRPGIIWQVASAPETSTVVILPLTSNPRTLRFAWALLLAPSLINGLTAPSVALVFQLNAPDRRRAQGRIGQVEPPDLAQFQDIAKRMQRLPGPSPPCWSTGLPPCRKQ